MPTVFVYEYCCALGPNAVADSLLREGRAMRNALVEDICCIPNVTVRTLDEVDPTNEETAFRAAALVSDECLVIAPETNRILEQRIGWVASCARRLLGTPAEAVRQTADKLALAAVWEEHHVPTPRTWPRADWPGGAYPVVCKPRDGAGSDATYLVQSLVDFPARSDPDNALIQEFVSGQPASIAFLVGPGQSWALVPSIQHLSSDRRFQYEGGELPIDKCRAARAIELGRRAIDCVPGLLGYVGVDLILGDAADGSRDYAIEINPRLTTSYVGLRRLAEFNLAEAIRRVANGETVDELRWKRGRVRFWPDGTSVHNRDRYGDE